MSEKQYHDISSINLTPRFPILIHIPLRLNCSIITGWATWWANGYVSDDRLDFKNLRLHEIESYFICKINDCSIQI